MSVKQSEKLKRMMDDFIRKGGKVNQLPPADLSTLPTTSHYQFDDLLYHPVSDNYNPPIHKYNIRRVKEHFKKSLDKQI